MYVLASLCRELDLAVGYTRFAPHAAQVIDANSMVPVPVQM